MEIKLKGKKQLKEYIDKVVSQIKYPMAMHFYKKNDNYLITNAGVEEGYKHICNVYYGKTTYESLEEEIGLDEKISLTWGLFLMYFN